jgi:hypothetical protein
VATRRRYKDGGAVKSDNSSGADVESPVVNHEVRPAPSPEPDVDPVKRGLAEIQRAEQMYRDLAEQQRQANAGATPRQQRFIEKHPILMAPHVYPIARQAYLEALAAGLRPDTDENENFVLEKTSEALRRQRQMREAMPAPDHEHRVRLADELEREVAQQMDEPAPTSAPTKAPPPQRSMPISAPVSRAMPSMTSGAMPTRITLNPEQIMVARNSFTDPSLTDAQKEKMYAMNLMKMMQMRKAGTLNE